MIVTHSILQILDLKSGSHSFSETELDLSSDTTIDYILKKTEGKTLIFVTHEEQEAVWLKADKTLKFMKDYLIK